MLIAVGFGAEPGFAQTPTTADIPDNIYSPDRISPQTRQAIAEEEAIRPNDGSQDDAVADGHPGGTVPSKSPPKNEAAQVLEDAKKDAPVTTADMDACLKAWDPQTQMTKSEWANSCRSSPKSVPMKP